MINPPLHLDILPDDQKQLFSAFGQQDWIQRFYLAGGTGIALQIGHRQSIDFDFFFREDLQNRAIVEHIRRLGKFELFSEAENTIHGRLNKVQISFFSYHYPLLHDCLNYQKLRIASLLDIALMKLEAISGRGSKKDFVDLFFLLERFTLSDLLEAYTRKFGADISNHYHLMKSLVYFDDAENQPMPVMHQSARWSDIKNMIIGKVRQLDFRS